MMDKELKQQLNDPDCPLLTKQQLLFLDDIYLVLDDIFLNSSSADLLSEKGEFEVIQQISVIQENLKIIISNLKVGRSAKRRFVQGFPKWKKIRYDCIEKLNEICVLINSDRFNCNVSKLVGYSTSFLGGLLTLVSAITLIPSLGATTPLLISGATMTGAGCATTIGTSITEVVLLKSRIGQAQELIEEDKKAIQNLGDWIIRATELQNALIEILNMCPYEDVTNAVKDLVERASKIKGRHERMRSIKTALEGIIKMFLEECPVLPLMKIATIISVLVIIFQLLKDVKNRFVFDLALFTVKSISAFGFFLDDIFDIASLVNSFSKNAALAGNMSKAITRGAISVFGMALDVTGIILTSIDVHKGSLSPEAEKISKTAKELKEEAEKIEIVYAGICEIKQ